MRLISLLAAVALFSVSVTAAVFVAASPEAFTSFLAGTSVMMLVVSTLVMLQHWLLAFLFRQTHAMQRIVAERHGSARVDDDQAELPPRCRSCDAGVIGYSGAYRISDHGLVSLEETNQPCGCRVHHIRLLGAVTAPRV
jgi:hypothetical protein